MLFLSCCTSKVVAVLIFVRAMVSAINMQNFKKKSHVRQKIKRYLFESTFSGTPGTYEMLRFVILCAVLSCHFRQMPKNILLLISPGFANFSPLSKVAIGHHQHIIDSLLSSCSPLRLVMLCCVSPFALPRNHHRKSVERLLSTDMITKHVFQEGTLPKTEQSEKNGSKAKAARDDWFNQAELSTVSLSVEGGEIIQCTASDTSIRKSI